MLIKGKIILEHEECPNCDSKSIFGTTMKEVEACKSCGARFTLKKFNTNNDYDVEAEYVMDSFMCMEQGYFDKCTNLCFAPYMYCQEHSDVPRITAAEDRVQRAKDALKEAEDKLNMIKESRKNWIIKTMSGIEDEDSV